MSGKEARRSPCKEHDRSNAGEEGYAVICARWEGGKTDGTRPLRSQCCTM